MELTNVLAILVLVVGVPLNALVTLMLWRHSRTYPGIGVLRERLIAAAGVLVLTIVFGLIFFNNDTVSPPLPVDVTKLITRTVLLGVAVIPAIYWLILYRSGR